MGAPRGGKTTATRLRVRFVYGCYFSLQLSWSTEHHSTFLLHPPLSLPTRRRRHLEGRSNREASALPTTTRPTTRPRTQTARNRNRRRPALRRLRPAPRRRLRKQPDRAHSRHCASQWPAVTCVRHRRCRGKSHRTYTLTHRELPALQARRQST